MKTFDRNELKKLYIPPKDSHKGQNGKLLIVGGSHLFHAASLWALKVASRIVDMVFYSSVPENNEIVQKAKEEFRDGIVIPRSQLESYIKEADCILVGPGMVRAEGAISNIKYQISNIKEVDEIEHEGLQTYHLTKYLLSKYPQKKWVIDAGSLQMMEAEWLKKLNGNVIITPHRKEFKRLFDPVIPNEVKNLGGSFANAQDDIIERMAREYNCIILLKGPTDIVCSPFDSAQGETRCVRVSGGNPGMTKGGTGDVLAGLVAALACKNDLFLAAMAGSFINKKAGDSLYEKVGPYFNASDLADEIPKVMKAV